jgi:hypothetical protein
MSTLGSLTFIQTTGHVPKRGAGVELVDPAGGGGPSAVIIPDRAEPGTVRCVGLFDTIPDWKALQGQVLAWSHSVGHSGNVLIVGATADDPTPCLDAGVQRWLIACSFTLLAEPAA